jgi:ATP-dependent DNA helicase RecG
VDTNDGFEIAEADLRLRGPGDLMGTQQSGLLSLKIADVVKDQDILRSARFYAQQLLRKDPGLELAEHRMVRDKMARMDVFRTIWDYIS